MLRMMRDTDPLHYTVHCAFSGNLYAFHFLALLLFFKEQSVTHPDLSVCIVASILTHDLGHFL